MAGEGTQQLRPIKQVRSDAGVQVRQRGLSLPLQAARACV